MVDDRKEGIAKGEPSPAGARDKTLDEISAEAPGAVAPDPTAHLEADNPDHSPNYQRAGLARQMLNELELLVAYGGGDGDRAEAIRRALEDLDLPEKEGKGKGPIGRATRRDKMVQADSSKPTQTSGSGLAPGVSVPPAGSATVTTQTSVSTKAGTETKPPDKPASK